MYKSSKNRFAKAKIHKNKSISKSICIIFINLIEKKLLHSANSCNLPT